MSEGPVLVPLISWGAVIVLTYALLAKISWTKDRSGILANDSFEVREALSALIVGFIVLLVQGVRSFVDTIYLWDVVGATMYAFFLFYLMATPQLTRPWTSFGYNPNEGRESGCERCGLIDYAISRGLVLNDHEKSKVRSFRERNCEEDELFDVTVKAMNFLCRITETDS